MSIIHFYSESEFRHINTALMSAQLLLEMAANEYDNPNGDKRHAKRYRMQAWSALRAAEDAFNHITKEEIPDTEGSDTAGRGSSSSEATRTSESTTR